MTACQTVSKEVPKEVVFIMCVQTGKVGEITPPGGRMYGGPSVKVEHEFPFFAIIHILICVFE